MDAWSGSAAGGKIGRFQEEQKETKIARTQKCKNTERCQQKNSRAKVRPPRLSRGRCSGLEPAPRRASTAGCRFPPGLHKKQNSFSPAANRKSFYSSRTRTRGGRWAGGRRQKITLPKKNNLFAHKITPAARRPVRSPHLLPPLEALNVVARAHFGGYRLPVGLAALVDRRGQQLVLVGLPAARFCGRLAAGRSSCRRRRWRRRQGPPVVLVFLRGKIIRGVFLLRRHPVVVPVVVGAGGGGGLVRCGSDWDQRVSFSVPVSV